MFQTKEDYTRFKVDTLHMKCVELKSHLSAISYSDTSALKNKIKSIVNRWLKHTNNNN